MGAPTQPGLAPLGVVVIGRNEGERLMRCLDSLPRGAARVVYVDSGSTDGSVARARAVGAEVVELDLSVPFTAARARNAGAGRLAELAPQPGFVLFLDGDCELAAGFAEHALEQLEHHPRWAAVAGRLRERHPEASLYNRLCALEWKTEVGPVRSVGGICMVRASAFDAVGGFDDRIIAGEEPELCWRLRQAGFEVHRIDREMAVHDADMRHLGQWWRRQVRAGHACAENYALHGRVDFGHYGRAFYSALVYGLGLPLVAVGAIPWTYGASLGLLLAYVRLYRRAVAWRTRLGDSAADADAYARYLVLGSAAQALGIVRYAARRSLGRPRHIIEYKGARAGSG